MILVNEAGVGREHVRPEVQAADWKERPRAVYGEGTAAFDCSIDIERMIADIPLPRNPRARPRHANGANGDLTAERSLASTFPDRVKSTRPRSA